MAPKRKPSDNTTTSAAATATRLTRSSTRLANAATPPPTAVAEPPPAKKKKTKTTTTTAAAAAVKQPPPTPTKVDAGESKTIVIEHCKQCNQFKIRAIRVKEGLEKGVAGVNVVVNPEKPRRGCFEIREEGGGIFVSLLEMKRPFAPMKALDMDKVISDIIDKIK